MADNLLSLHKNIPEQLPTVATCLASYIFQGLQGVLLIPPEHYSSSSSGQVVHASSEVVVEAGSSLVPISAAFNDCILLYHYTMGEVHSKIAHHNRSLWAT